MKDKMKNVLIGLFALMTILIIVGTILFLQPSIGDGEKIINVRFSNISGLHIGTRVTFCGKPVGEVEDIIEVDDIKKSRKDEFGKVYYYQLKLKVDSSIDIYDCDVITVQTTGLMGEKSVGFIAKPFPKNRAPKLVTNEILYAKPTDSFEEAADQISQITNKAERVLDNLNGWFEDNSKNITTSISTLKNSMDTVNNFLQTATQNKTFDKVNKVVDNLNNTTENISYLTQNLNKANSTLGKLFNSDELYLNFGALLSKTNTLLNDINNYGILFQYSKSWQRIRTKRATALEALNNPTDFKNFFEKEVSDITASLSRINQLVSKADSKNERQKILSSNSYKKNFSSLLRQVEALLNMIKLYNQDLYDKTNAQ